MSNPRSVSWDVSVETVPDAFERYLVAMANWYEVSGVGEADRRTFFNRSRTTLTMAGAIGYGACVRQTLSRGPATLRRSDIDGLNLLINDAAIVGDADGREVRAEPGAIQLRDMTRPAASRLDRVEVTTLVIPRVAAPAALLSREAHGVVIQPQAPSARLMRNHLMGLETAAADLSDDEVEAAVQGLLLLAVKVMGLDHAQATEPVAAALHRTVRQVVGARIERALQTGPLAPDSDELARFASVSRATLYRAFDIEGGVARYVQTRRLHHARTALARRQGGVPTIADIGYRYGFASPTHFSRQFRRQFGYSPSDVEPPAVPEGVERSAGPIRHDLLVDWMEQLKFRTP